jgi:hypothetical protein
MLRYFMRGGLKPRASFESAAESRAYAKRRLGIPKVGRWVVFLLGLGAAYNTIDSLVDKDAETHPTPASLGILAVELLTVQFLHNRAETANNRSQDTNEGFSAARDAELAGRRPREVEASKIDAKLDGLRAETARQASKPSAARQESLDCILVQANPESPKEPTPPDAQQPPPENHDKP